MPQPNKIPKPFAASGDKNTIPESTETIGLASWNEGFPAITSTPFAEGGLAPKRNDFNGIFNALSAATVWQQQGGFYAYDNATDYEVGNVVEYSGDLYKCLTANGPSSAVKAPTDATVWAKVILTTATQSAAGYMSASDKTALDGVPTTYLPLSGGTMTGTIESTVDHILKKSTTTGSLIMLSGNNTSSASGANIVLRGGGHASKPGEFTIHAGNSNGYKQLVGKPDGTLTWDGKSLVDNGAFNKMFFSQTSGSYTAPYTGVYRITLKGGGGGGGGQGSNKYSSGGGGGEGGLLTFYTQLTKDQNYAYTIGAGGLAGADSATGDTGGTTGFTTNYRVWGGYGGLSGDASYRAGGSGGIAYSIPNGESAYFVPGARGVSGVLCTNGSDLTSAAGGGSGGGCTGGTPIAGIYGGGGGGGILDRGATAGGDGYILIEYAG